MADITAKITRKSLKAKKKAAIRTIKSQAKEKIREVKIEYASNPNRKKAKAIEKEQRKALKQQKKDARIAYNVRQPRQYSLGEDLFNAISHGIGAGLSVAAIVLLIIRAALYTPEGESTGLYVTAFTLFGSALFILYMMSTLYHSITPFTARKVFSILNHIAIYVLIAGTYTPFVLTLMPGNIKWVVFIVVWSISAFFIVLYSILGARMKKFSEFTYMVMGWILILCLLLSPVGESLSVFCKTMLLTGALAYSFGSLFYLMRNYKWAHSIFHLFVLAGSVLHFFAVLFSI